jgi:tetratricopeptide (TPR) repeat protein
MKFLMISILFVASTPDLETGIALRQEGRFEEAIQILEEVVSAQPDSFEAQRELGHALVLAGKYQEAIAAYEKLAASGDAQWQIEAAKWSGLTYLYLGEIDKSLAGNARESELAREAGDRAARILAAWYRGHIFIELGRLDEANSTFLDALEWAMDDVDILHHAGVMTARQGDAGSLRYQIEDLQQAVRRLGDESQIRRVYHLQAELALLQGKPKEAMERIEQANRLAPHPYYREPMARTYLALDDAQAAEEVYRKIISATDERLDVPLYYVMALRGLAEVLETLGRAEEAAVYWQRFLSHWGDVSPPLPGVTEAKTRLSAINPSR